MRNPLVYVLFLLSGAAGLVYELVWVRELIFVFGGTTHAITTVVVAFMAGLGLGSFVAGRCCHRLHRPACVYGLLEIGIGLYALVVPLLLGMAEPSYRGLYPHLAATPWLLNMFRFAISGLVLLIPTTCMGATLPILVRHVTLRGLAVGRSVGYLYGINTLGAVLGVVLAGFWLIPAVGLTHTTWLAAAANLLIGVTALVFLSAKKGSGTFSAGITRRSSGKPLERAEKGPDPFLPAPLRRVLLIGFAISGFSAMVYQITWTRALIMSLGSSTYSFTCILAAFILGLAAGSLAIARWVDRRRNPLLVFGVMELLIGLVAVLIVPIYGQVPYWMQSLVAAHRGDYGALLRSQFVLIIAITFVPTFLMGAVFPLVTRALASNRDEAGAVTGRAYAVNTLGTIAGSFLAGFVLIRSAVLGVQSSIILASLLNGLVGVTLIGLAQPASGSSRIRRIIVSAAGLLLIPLTALVTGGWDRCLLTAAPYLDRGDIRRFVAGHQVVYYAEGVDLTVAVHRQLEAADAIILSVNGKPDASTSEMDTSTQLLLGHLPALTGAEGKAACVIGLGSGMTLSALAQHPSYQRLDCVEISGEVIQAAEHFAPYTYDVLADEPRLRMIRADGRNHLLLTDQYYDLIVSEPSNPWISGVANLFTREFFELAQSRLTDQGRLAAWLQGYGMSVRDFQMVTRTLLEVFDHVSLWGLCADDYLLIASRQPQRFAFDDFLRRFEVPAVRGDLYRAGIHRPAQILGRYVASDRALRAWVAGAPIHTDDNARLEFSAPRYLYAGERRRLARSLLELQCPVLEDLLSGSGAAWPTRLASEVAGVLAGRAAFVRSDELRARGDVVGTLRLVVDGYQRDPSNIELYRRIVDARVALQKSSDLARDPELAGLLARLQLLEAPPVISPRGATLAEIADGLRARGRRAALRSEWGWAANFLEQAWRLEPDDRRTALALVENLMRLDRTTEATEVLDMFLRQHPDDGLASYWRALFAVQAADPTTALALLRTAVQSGEVSARTLATDDLLRSLWDDPRFKALVQQSESKPPPSRTP